MLSAFGVDHGGVSKGLNPLKAFQAARKVKPAAGPASFRQTQAKPFKVGIPQDSPAQARQAKLGAARAHEAKVTGNKPAGFTLAGQQDMNSMYRGPLNTGQPKRSR